MRSRATVLSSFPLCLPLLHSMTLPSIESYSNIAGYSVAAALDDITFASCCIHIAPAAAAAAAALPPIPPLPLCQPPLRLQLDEMLPEVLGAEGKLRAPKGRSKVEVSLSLQLGQRLTS